jgi:hypothetical protein
MAPPMIGLLPHAMPLAPVLTPAGSKLGYSSMAFSRDGERLAAIGHAREPKLFVWALEDEVR